VELQSYIRPGMVGYLTAVLSRPAVYDPAYLFGYVG